jgi:hypothetical protein
MSSRYHLRLTNGVLGRGKAVTNICKQGASAWVKHATVRMLQINNALIGYFPPISAASPISTTPFPTSRPLNKISVPYQATSIQQGPDNTTQALCTSGYFPRRREKACIGSPRDTKAINLFNCSANRSSSRDDVSYGDITPRAPAPTIHPPAPALSAAHGSAISHYTH